MLDPSILRVSVSGNILNLSKPKSTLAEKFLPIKVSHCLSSSSRLIKQEAKALTPISLSSATLTELGKNPSSTVSRVGMSCDEPVLITADCPRSHACNRGIVRCSLLQRTRRVRSRGSPSPYTCQRDSQRVRIILVEIDSRIWVGLWRQCRARPREWIDGFPGVPSELPASIPTCEM